MIEALEGGLLGLVAGALSVLSLWLVTGFAAQAARGLRLAPERPERPTGWDAAAQDPDVPTAGQWWKKDEETPKAPLGDAPQESIKGATFRIFLAFLLKAPLLLAVALVARSLGSVALHWCVGGVMLVYSFAVFWAAAHTAKR